MNDAAEIAISWVVIFMVFLFAISTGLYIHDVDQLATFNQQVEPIIERYGGTTSVDLYHDGSTAQSQIQKIEKSMDNHGNTFTVSSSDDSGTNERTYGKPIYFNTNIKTAYNFGSHRLLDRTITNSVPSKVGA